MHRYRSWVPWLDALYGSATFLPMADGALYEIKVSQSGLVARPLNQAAPMRSAAGTKNRHETPDTHRKNSSASLLLLLIAAGIGWWRAGSAGASIQTTQRGYYVHRPCGSEHVHDRSTIGAACRRTRRAVIQPIGGGIADHELDLAFTEALRDVEAHPPTLTADAAAIQARITKSQALLSADQQRVNDSPLRSLRRSPTRKTEFRTS